MKKNEKLNMLRERVKMKKEEPKDNIIYENSLAKIEKDFSIRVTKKEVRIKDTTTSLTFTPNKMGDIVLNKQGDKLIITIEKE